MRSLILLINDTFSNNHTLYYDYYSSLVQSSLRAAAVQHVLRTVVAEGSLRQSGGTGAGLQSTGGVLPILYVWVDA